MNPDVVKFLEQAMLQSLKSIGGQTQAEIIAREHMSGKLQEQTLDEATRIAINAMHAKSHSATMFGGHPQSAPPAASRDGRVTIRDAVSGTDCNI